MESDNMPMMKIVKFRGQDVLFVDEIISDSDYSKYHLYKYMIKHGDDTDIPIRIDENEDLNTFGTMLTKVLIEWDVNDELGGYMKLTDEESERLRNMYADDEGIVHSIGEYIDRTGSIGINVNEWAQADMDPGGIVDADIDDGNIDESAE